MGLDGFVATPGLSRLPGALVKAQMKPLLSPLPCLFLGQKSYYLHLGNSPEEWRLISFLRSLQFAGNYLMAFKISFTICP